MKHEKRLTFQFGNNTSPRYIDTLFLPLQTGQWYNKSQLAAILHENGVNVEGDQIISSNTLTWSLIGLGETRHKAAKSNINGTFRLTELGKQLTDIYSTNSELFYDLIHFLFYSAYRRSHYLTYSRFWLYQAFCNILWSESPTAIEPQKLTNRLQIEFREDFPHYEATFNDKSIHSLGPWLQVLTPPFLLKIGGRNHAQKRLACTPQLFHLATDFVYNSIGQLEYGTSFAINQPQIEAICKVCLLDSEYFWNMASLTQMTISGFEFHQGQWEKAIILRGPPDWINLPDFSAGQEENGFEEENEKDE
jgi:hypothetical protein